MSFKMKWWHLLPHLILIIYIEASPYRPALEIYHDPYLVKPPRFSEGVDLPKDYESPDYRIEEDTWYIYIPYASWFMEENRPYRISPFYKQTYKFGRNKENPNQLGCYCTTVYKRLTMLAGCAVITTRHILTTASSTEMVLSKHRNATDLTNILGAWYETNTNTFNSSLYMTPCRIHYHPAWVQPHEVNQTHPMPFIYDLAVWAGTHTFYGGLLYISRTQVCYRGGSHSYEYMPSTPRPGDIALVVGYQFMKAQRRRPMPWFKYVVRTRDTVVPCPKVEWGWFHCLPSTFWAKYGLESGAAWHRALENRFWLYDGLIGLNAFSMRLRHTELVSYFTVLNSHPVLNFLYSSYMGRLPYRFLDHRFYDTQWQAPWRKPWSYLYEGWDFGTEIFKESNLPVY